MTTTIIKYLDTKYIPSSLNGTDMAPRCIHNGSRMYPVWFQNVSNMVPQCIRYGSTMAPTCIQYGSKTQKNKGGQVGK